MAPGEVRFAEGFLRIGREMSVFAGFVAFAVLLVLDLATAPRQQEQRSFGTVVVQNAAVPRARLK
jgi:hypothetical protein